MSLQIVIQLCVLAVLVPNSFAAQDIDLSSYWKTCNRDDPELDDCLKSAVAESLPRLMAGVPELGLPPLDPYKEDELKVEYKKNQIYAKMTLKNYITVGQTTSTVHRVRAKLDEDKMLLEIDMSTPEVRVWGDYKAEGHYNTLQVNAKGKFVCNMTDLKYTWKLHGTPEQGADGESYMRVTRFDMRPDVGDMKVHATGIFSDNKDLEELANNAANQNWRLIYRELLPYAQDNWDRIGKHVANMIFLKVPYNKIFPLSTD